MNQILSTEDLNNKNRRNKGSKDINSILKFFAIMLIIFGMFLIANSSFAILNKNNDTSSDNKQISDEKPEIQVENKTEKQLILTIMHEDIIKSVEYYWNDEEAQTISGEGRKYIQTKIDIPNGTNTLTVKATDINGQVGEYSKEYELKGNIDIEIKQSGNNIKVNATSKENIKNLEYAWDEEDAKTIEVNDKEYAFEVEVLLGEHDLLVKVTDEAGNEEEKTMKVTGTTKPTVTIEAGNDCYVIKAHDDIGLDRVEIETVSDGKVTKMQPDGKDFEYNFPLKEGDENYIKVTAYNTNGVQSKIKKAVWKK